MADGDEDDLSAADLALQLNSLDRFRKQSPSLLLEQYSHCEVPAGCGGVVLRWVDPRKGTPARVVVVVPGARANAWLDGRSRADGRFDVEPGEHLLAIELSEIGDARWVMVGLLRDLADEAMSSTPVVLTGSRSDGGWQISERPRGERWFEDVEPAGDDDDGWRAMADGSERVDAEARESWRHRTLRSVGLVPLALDRAQVHEGRAWIRHRFTSELLDPSSRPRGRR